MENNNSNRGFLGKKIVRNIHGYKIEGCKIVFNTVEDLNSYLKRLLRGNN